MAGAQIDEQPLKNCLEAAKEIIKNMERAGERPGCSVLYRVRGIKTIHDYIIEARTGPCALPGGIVGEGQLRDPEGRLARNGAEYVLNWSKDLIQLAGVSSILKLVNRPECPPHALVDGAAEALRHLPRYLEKRRAAAVGLGSGAAGCAFRWFAQ